MVDLHPDPCEWCEGIEDLTGCGQGAHFWGDDQPAKAARCECGEWTYGDWVKRKC